MTLSDDACHAFVAVALTTIFAVVLLGVPSCSRPSGVSAEALRQVDRLLADGQFSRALPLALENRRRYPGESVAAWQVARTYEGLKAPADEAAAWEAYLAQSSPTSEVCLRLSDVYRELLRPEQVIATVDRCLALDDRQPELLGDLATARWSEEIAPRRRPR